MTCAKCGGLVVDDGEDERCVNCGHRRGVPVHPFTPVPVKVSPLAGDDGRHKERTMGKWSEETRAAFREKLRAAWAKKRKGGATAEEPTRSTAVTVPAARPITVVAHAGAEAEAVAGLDAAIAQRREELAVLERARELVLRG